MLQRLFHDFGPGHIDEYACGPKSFQLRVSQWFPTPLYNAYCTIWDWISSAQEWKPGCVWKKILARLPVFLFLLIQPGLNLRHPVQLPALISLPLATETNVQQRRTWIDWHSKQTLCKVSPFGWVDYPFRHFHINRSIAITRHWQDGRPSMFYPWHW